LSFVNAKENRMRHFVFPFDVVKKLVAQAEISGTWRRDLKGRWTLSIGNAELRWSPTRSELSFHGPSEDRARLRAAVEGALKSNLIAPAEGNADDDNDLEVINTEEDLLGWLVRYMRSGKKCEYPAPLVVCADEIVEMVVSADRSIPKFTWLGDAPLAGRVFAQLIGGCETQPYSPMLMGWSGRLHDGLVRDYVDVTEAVDSAIEAAGLQGQLRYEDKQSGTWVVSTRTFVQQFNLRVRAKLTGSFG
jgi:hypothetical protein